MMNFKYFLSLVMPTFNRKTEIQVSIKSILSTLRDDEFKNDIELVVLDNASDYDIEDTLQDILNLSKNKLSIRIIKNGENIGNDQNFLKGLCEAQGKYILQCSDRYYYYNIDFSFLIPLLITQNSSSIIFSDRFRKYTLTEITINNSFNDEWLKEEFNIINENDTFFEIDKEEFIESNYIKSGLINSFSDLILPNRGKEYFVDKLDEFKKSHMLGVTAQLDAISATKSIHIFRVNFNTIIHQNIGKGNLYNRHNYNEVVEGNLLIQKKYPFIGTENEIKLLQVGGLIGLLMSDSAGLYCSVVKPNLKLIEKIINENSLKLRWHQKIDLFLLRYNFPSSILTLFIFIKNLYVFLLNEKSRIKTMKETVKLLNEKFK